MLLDDPLSAVDPDVAEKIFNGCILGAMKDKCVILTTHQIQFLKGLDKIVYLNGNKIEIEGSYEELRHEGIDFDQILEEYQKQAKDDIFDDEEDADDQDYQELDEEEQEKLPPIDSKYLHQKHEHKL